MCAKKYFVFFSYVTNNINKVIPQQIVGFPGKADEVCGMVFRQKGVENT